MKRISFNEGWEYAMQSDGFLGTVTEEFRPVTLPHDAMICRPRNRDAAGKNNSGYYPEGVYEYRKRFTVPEEWKEKRIIIEFEAAYMQAMVYINGMFAGSHAYGYTQFYIKADAYLHYGEENEIRVVTRNYKDSRWYSGAGLYRDVSLYTADLVHALPDQLKITVESADKNRAVVSSVLTIVNEGISTVKTFIKTEFCCQDGSLAAENKVPVTIFPGEKKVIRQRVSIPNPKLWNVDTPYLYTCRARIMDKSAQNICRDETETTFGIRMLSLSVENGLLINGVETKLRGGCIHHDQGILGAASIARAEERRVELMKESGFNALRISHNPASRALLDACDRVGMLVMDEAFDSWHMSKNAYDYSIIFNENWEEDVTKIVDKDYNHPSVILYSIGNEIPDTGNEEGAECSRKIAEKFRQLDPGRYIINSINMMLSSIGAGSMIFFESQDLDINSTMAELGDNMQKQMAREELGDYTEESYGTVDVAGYNYADGRYETDHEKYPNRIICGSETFVNRIGESWPLIKKLPYVIGDFTWTAWDYLGECGIGKVDYTKNATWKYGDYPWFAAYCGDFDLIGTRRAQSYYRETVFGQADQPYIVSQNPSHYGKKPVFTPWSFYDYVPTWNWKGQEGKAIVLQVYADADQVEVLINDRSLGVKQAGRECGFITEYETVYEPGTVTVRAYKDGQKTGTNRLSSGGEGSLLLHADRKVLRADHRDLAFVSILHSDQNGVIIPNDDIEVSVTVEGAGVLQGLGSARPWGEENFYEGKCTTFCGKAMAVVRPECAGKIVLSVQSGRYGVHRMELEAKS
ncbi:glycoside hydrolase family 2 TIM barrel-domain containing protein [Sporofaciens musculi]|uniref:glycoside hydrolase family 2 TIM barrel-domain containing protein n=1 Tax=Sporofaciens musculi TaxID=2681861 RepID=UPI002570293F|nr:glycoside hydrolase family 2 TIM barrel-domain containing protein [Sporofaciens musculi]